MNSIKKFWKKLGPGFITGSSDDDPSGIATYAQAGATFGFLTLWTALITYPLMFSIQEMCARIGIVSGVGLGGVLKRHYPKVFVWLVLACLFSAITFNIAADLAGMGAVAHMLVPIFPIWLYACFFTVLLFVCLAFFSYSKIAYFLKWLSLSLFVYLVVPFTVSVQWEKVLLSTFIPQFEFSQKFFSLLVAILGTTISPYLFFWQTSMSVEEQNHKPNIPVKREIREMKSDVNVGMFWSNFVMFFIILTTGAVLFPAGITHIETVQDAAKALEPLVGPFAYLLFALGVISTGLLAIPVLAGCLGYLFADAFGWKQGMDKRPAQAKEFYSVIFISMAIGFALNVLNFDPIKALIYTAIIYGLITPLLIALLLHICNRKKIMGNNTNTLWSNVLGFFTLVLMGGAAFLLIAFS